MSETMFEYVCKDKKGNLFATYGDFNLASNRPCSKFSVVKEKSLYPYWFEVKGYGYRKNVSDGRLPDTFKIIYQRKVVIK